MRFYLRARPLAERTGAVHEYVVRRHVSATSRHGHYRTARRDGHTCPNDFSGDARTCREIPGLSKPAWRIGWRRNMGRRRQSARVCRDFVGRWLRQSDAHVHFEVFLRTARAVAFARILIAQTREFVAAVDAVAISRNGRSLDGYKSHLIFPFPQDSTGTAEFSQGRWNFQTFPRSTQSSAGTAGRAFPCFPAIRSRACPASPGRL